MAPGTTITVARLRELANIALAVPNSSLYMKAPGKDRDLTAEEAFRMGHISVLETILRETGNFRGFTYQDGQVTWPDGPDGDAVVRDETRRVYG
jgi:hypothetical protein